jgi:bacterioferritin-associated ferredoxin
MTPTEKAIRDFCGHHADWWPSPTQVQEMLALAQPCSTCEALARAVMMDQTSHDNFKLDWDAMAVMVEEQQRMAKRIAELEKPVQGPWVGLTKEEILDLFDLNNVYGSKWIEFARAIEQLLKEKNT